VANRSLAIEGDHYWTKQLIASLTEKPPVSPPAKSGIAKAQEAWERRMELSERGRVAFERKDFPAAASAYRAILELDAGNTGALLNLGGALYSEGRYSEASDAFQRLTSVAPNSAEAWYWLCVSYDAQGDRDRTRQAYNRLRGLDGSRADDFRQKHGALLW